MSRDQSTPIDGLGGLGVPINLLPLLLMLLGAFYHPHKGTKLPGISHLLIVVGSLLWLEQLSNFLSPAFAFLFTLFEFVSFYLSYYSFSGSRSSAPLMVQTS